jgi:glycosyltransferase involved in cell wall biosynthesis
LHAARFTHAAVTIHDVIFKHFPDYYKAADRRIYDAKTRYAVRHAHALIVLNHTTGKDLVNFYGADPSRIHFLEQPVKPNFEATFEKRDLELIASNLHLPTEFILYVGTIEPRKNLELIIESLRIIPATKRPKLVVAGRGTAYLDKVKELVGRYKMEPDVLFFHNLADTELAALYHLARLYVNPSLLEGFGAPILEALTCGTPVLCSDAEFFRATFKERCNYATLDSAEEWAQSIENLSTAGARVQPSLVEFTHEYVATRLMHIYKTILSD